jgi:hypothetical protein
MKIVDVALTLFRWDGVPPVDYGPNTPPKSTRARSPLPVSSAKDNC